MTRVAEVVYGEAAAIQRAYEIADEDAAVAYIVNRGDGGYIVGVTQTYAENENRHGHEIFAIQPATE